MIRVTSRSEPLFQPARVWLRFMITQIIWFSSDSLSVIFKNTVRVRLRFCKNSIKPIYKTPVRVRFDSLLSRDSVGKKNCPNPTRKACLQTIYSSQKVLTTAYKLPTLHRNFPKLAAESYFMILLTFGRQQHF